MNDRLQIAAMQLAALSTITNWPEEAYGAPRGVGKYQYALNEADALLAKAGDDDPALHEDCVGVPIYNVVVGHLQDEISTLKTRIDHVNDMKQKAWDEIARLKAELERVTAPLTMEERPAVEEYEYINRNNGILSAIRWDRAITAVKIGRK